MLVDNIKRHKMFFNVNYEEQKDNFTCIVRKNVVILQCSFFCLIKNIAL